jgi:hypothetical protein
LSWTYAQGASGHTVTSTLTIPLPGSTPAGNLLDVALANYNSAVGTVSVHDDVGVSFTRAVGLLANSVDIEIWYRIAPSTRTYSVIFSNISYIAVAVDDFSPGGGSPTLDNTASNSGSSTTPSSGNVTIAGNDLVYGAAGTSAAQGAFTAGSGYTLTESVGYSNSSNQGVAGEYKLNVSTGPVNPGMTLGTSAPWAMAAATFKLPPSGVPIVIGSPVVNSLSIVAGTVRRGIHSDGGGSGPGRP